VTLWQGRLPEGSAGPLFEFTESFSFDRRLAADDIAGSKAHVRGLVRGGILSAEEGSILEAALNRVGEELASAGARSQDGPSQGEAGASDLGATRSAESKDEDVHSLVERRVTELCGDIGEKLHTGRSRNDQVALDLRLYSRRELLVVARELLALEEVLYKRAVEADDAYLPGYTHLQHAQPVLLGHHLLAHGWALSRDVDRIMDALRRLNVSPLGAGALAGSSLNLDPAESARSLGFTSSFDNSLDAVSDRDFVAEALFVLAMLGVHLSRMGEELVLWASEEFGFLQLDDAFATGSSMLPQKKNPDIAELARGKSGRLIGHLTGLLATLKGLPLSYNRDLQEDKEPLFDAFEQVHRALPALGGLLETATFNLVAMKARADDATSSAVDLAELLVEEGMPFRQAHALVGGMVRDSLERHVPLAELVEAHPALGSRALWLLAPGVAVTRRTTQGGAGPKPVEVQLGRFLGHIELDRERIEQFSALIAGEGA